MDFTGNIFRDTAERIKMVTHHDCPLDLLEAVANDDTEKEVILACANNIKVTKKILDIVKNRCKISDSELVDYQIRYRKQKVKDPNLNVEQLKQIIQHEVEKSVILECLKNENADETINYLIQEKCNLTKNQLQEYKNNKLPEKLANFNNIGCAIPWVHVATNSNGSIRACCQMIYDQGEIPYGSIYKENNLPVTSQDDVYNHRNEKNWKILRKKMLNNEKHSACKLCWDEEDSGMRSKRQFINILYKDYLHDIVTKTHEDGSINTEDFPVKYWDLRFGNKCNLKCRSCGPNDSDQWYDDWLKLGEGKHFKTKDGGRVKVPVNKLDDVPDIFKWVNNNKLMDSIKENITSTDRFYFTGGEPTVNKPHKDLLDFIIEKKLSKNISLEYNTNMASIPDELFNKWSNFKEVRLGMSIDGIFEYFEYIRHPGKWESVEKNLKKIDKDPRLNNIKATFTVTCSIMNIVHILDLIWWVKNKNFTRIESELYIHQLYNPKFYNVQNLPNDVKAIITNLYHDFIDAIYLRWGDMIHQNWLKKTEKSLNAILNHMNSIECNDIEYERFFERQTKLDKIRKENFFKSCKSIADILNYSNEKKKRKIILEVNQKKKKK